jgi:hypothetical protein
LFLPTGISISIDNKNGSSAKEHFTIAAFESVSDAISGVAGGWLNDAGGVRMRRLMMNL